MSNFGLLLPPSFRRAPKQHQFIAPLVPDMVLATAFNLVGAISRLDATKIQVQIWYEPVGTNQSMALAQEMEVHNADLMHNLFVQNPKAQPIRDDFFRGVVAGHFLPRIAEAHGFDYADFYRYMVGAEPGTLPVNPQLN